MVEARVRILCTTVWKCPHCGTLVTPGNTHYCDGTYFDVVRPRVLCVTDAARPLTTSGFAVPGREVIDGLLDAGYIVIHLARGGKFDPDDIPVEWRNKPVKVFAPPQNDPNGYQWLGYLLDVECEFEPVDCIFYIADPESIRAWRTNVQARVIDARTPRPTVTYGPTEGGPVLKPDSTCLAEILAMGGVVSTYTEYSANVMLQAVQRAFVTPSEAPPIQIKVIPHGIDHANFRQLGQDERAALRRKFGWTDKFVVMNVARNAGRKMWPSLFKAIALLAPKYKNLYLYAHTVPFEGYMLGGHNLPEIADSLGIGQRIIYPDRIPDPWHGVPYEQIIQAYNAADLFVSPSGAEGWNMPVNEAAACGLPVVCTAYSGMWEQAQEYALPLEPDGFVTHQCGVEMAYVSPAQIARNIEYAMTNPPRMQANVARGLEISKGRSWSALRQAAPLMVEEAIRGATKPA